MFSHLEAVLLSLVHSLPLELFMFIGSFVEEVIAPIPSPSVVLLAGSLASLKGWTIPGLLILSFVGALGKTTGASIIYLITDKAEDFIMEKLGRYFDVTHEDVERFGKRLGHGWRDYLLLTTFRTLPFIPSSVVSVGCGLLKVPFRLFVFATFFGTIMRDGIYLYMGYIGAHIFTSFLNRSASVETMLEFVAIFVFAGIIGYFYFRKRVRGS